MKYIYKQIIKYNNIELRGVLNTPDDFNPEKKYPTIIYFHGFADDRNGIQYMNIQNSKFMTANGFIVFRFDFSGCGESDGSFYDITLTRKIEEARMVCDFVSSKDYVDKDNIFWKGHSMGGSIATIIAAEKNPKAISLFAPAADYSKEENPLMKKIIEALKYDYKAKDGEDVGGLKIGEEFINDAQSYDIYELAKHYQGPVQILRGDEDEIISEKSVLKLKDKFKNASYHEISGTDHTFSNYEPRLLCFDLMNDFFNENLN